MNTLSSQELRQYETAFRKLGNRKDLLPVECVSDYVRLVGTTALPEELDELIPQYNVNGFVNFASILDLLSRIRSRNRTDEERTELLLLFKLLDEFNTGYVYVDELKQACLLAGDSLREKEFDHLMYVAGLKGHEKLSVYEYLHVLLYLPRDNL
ncbi:hypothetical protein DIPPA_35557 [Diplonema papillatum]|nr:hypothetical protein DIPPA_35557 [Diplonema papillatum]